MILDRIHWEMKSAAKANFQSSLRFDNSGWGQFFSFRKSSASVLSSKIEIKLYHDYTTELLCDRPRQDIQLLLMNTQGTVDSSVHKSKRSSLLTTPVEEHDSNVLHKIPVDLNYRKLREFALVSLFHSTRYFFPPSIVTHLSRFHFRLYWTHFLNSEDISACSCSVQTVGRAEFFGNS